MKYKRLKKVILLSTIILLLSLKFVKADVGSFDTYDSGSSSDWGSSSSDWGSSSSDWSWSSSDWDSSSSDYGSSSFDGFLIMWLLGTGEGRVIGGIILIIVIGCAIIKHTSGLNNIRYDYTKVRTGRRPTNKSSNPTTVYTTDVHDVSQTHIYTDEIKKIDPFFSEEKFLSWAKDLYVKMQHAWTDRNWENMRSFETEELFEQHSAQLQEYVRNNTINIIDRISVNYATIYNFKQTQDKDIVEVALKATKKDYIINAQTNKVVEGNPEQYRVTVYKMTFERTKGNLTNQGTDKLDAKNCPNCGAPLQFTSAGKCEYCGSIVTAGVHDWVLSGLEPLKR